MSNSGAYAGRASTARSRHDAQGESHEERMRRVEWIARLMDDRFCVPGTELRFGWDSIIGLVPGVGDSVTSLVSLMILHQAWVSGASTFTLARMLGNILLDLTLGAIPVLGDIFDLAFKSNRKNVHLLRRHLERSRSAPRL